MQLRSSQTSLVIVALLWPILLLSQSQPTLAPWRSGRLWGYADPETGQVKISPEFDSVGLFQLPYESQPCPLAWVKKNGQYALMNTAGTLVLPLVEAAPLPINRICEDSYMIERYAFAATSLQEETQILAAQENKYYFRPVAYFNAQGRPVVEPFMYETRMDGNMYVDDVDSEQEPDSLLKVLCNYRQIWKTGKMGLLDLRTGRMLLKPEFLFIQAATQVAYVMHEFLDTAYVGRRNGLIDLQTGKEWSVPDSIQMSVTPQTGNLILAENTRTKLFGFVSPGGRLIIPFQFKNALPFLSNGRAKVLRADEIWYEIDSKGREISRLGKSPFEFTDRLGHVWIGPDADGLYRIRQAPADLPLGRMGLDNVPTEVKLSGKICWIARKGYKSGLLDEKGRILLPFEFDMIDFGFQGPHLPQDTPVLKKYFSVTKNDRKWMFDTKTLQPLRPKLEPENGLVMGQTFDQSNFGLVQPISGDSVFQIEFSREKFDLLNIRTGRRWNTRNARNFRFSFEEERGGPYLYVDAADGSGVEERFSLDGRRAPWLTNGYNGYLKGLGNWRTGVDMFSKDVVVLDSADQVICRFPAPFEGQNRITIETNREGVKMPFAVVIKSEKGEMAVFSLQGRRVSPPGITSVWMTNDVLFAAQQEKWGAMLLPEGRQVLPFLYKQVLFRDGRLSAIDFSGTETQFDLQGNLLRTYPEGYIGISSFQSGLQLVTNFKERTFLNEQFEFVRFPGVIQAGPFYEGLAGVQMADQHWHYIRPTGEQAFEGVYALAGPFLKNRAVVTTTDGATQVIDTSGQVLLQSRRPGDCCNRPILPLGDNFFVVVDSFSRRVYNREGRLILENCTCASSSMQQGFAFFYCNGKFGRLQKDGEMEPLKKKDFVFEKDGYGRVRSVLPNFPCPVEGLLDSVSGNWIVEPRPNYRVAAFADNPIVFIYHKDSVDNQIVINRKSGKTLATNISILEEVRDLGWLVRQTGTDATFLYNLDFSVKKPWPAEYTQIRWNDSVQLYEVRKTDYTFVGYLSKQGHVLYKD